MSNSKRSYDKPSSRALQESVPSARTRNLAEAVREARDLLLGPVVSDLSYDMELTRRYRLAAEIVNDWPGLSHRERVALNSSLPWDEMVHQVCAATRRKAG